MINMYMLRTLEGIQFSAKLRGQIIIIQLNVFVVAFHIMVRMNLSLSAKL